MTRDFSGPAAAAGLFTVAEFPHAIMQRDKVSMFYDAASTSNLPSLYISCSATNLKGSCFMTLQATPTAPACTFPKNVLGRVPLMQCFESGSRTPTALVVPMQRWLIATKELAVAAYLMCSTPGCSRLCAVAGTQPACFCSRGRSAAYVSCCRQSLQRLWSVKERSEG